MGKKEKYILVRVTEKERNILKRKAKKVGLTVSDFMRSSLIHSDNLTINVIDTSVLSKTLFELHKHGVNLNQLMVLQHLRTRCVQREPCHPDP